MRSLSDFVYFINQLEGFSPCVCVNINVVLVIIVVIEKVQIDSLIATHCDRRQHKRSGQFPVPSVEFINRLHGIACHDRKWNDEVQGEPRRLVRHKGVGSH